MEDHIIIDILRFINVVVALAALPPSIRMLKILRLDRKKITNDKYTFNSLLADTFLIFTLILFLNATITFLLLINFNFEKVFGHTIGQTIFNIRNLGINFALFFVSWGIYLTTKKRG